MNTAHKPDHHEHPEQGQGPELTGDELTRAKLQLLARDETPQPHEGGAAGKSSFFDAPERLLREYPYVAALGALAGGFVVMRVGALRKIALGAALWGGKRWLARYMRGR